MIIIFVLFPKIHFYQEIFDTVKFEIQDFQYVATSSPQTHPTISYLCYSSYSQIKNIFTPLKKSKYHFNHAKIQKKIVTTSHIT